MNPTAKDLLSRVGTCEVCGEAATTYAVDYEEAETRDGFTCAKVVSKHAFCAAHARPGRTRNLDGTITEGSAHERLNAVPPLDLKTTEGANP